jgi:hypothetical protein
MTIVIGGFMTNVSGVARNEPARHVHVLHEESGLKGHTRDDIEVERVVVKNEYYHI